MNYLKHQVELTRINIFCLHQNLEVEEAEHAKVIELVDAKLEVTQKMET